MRGGLALRQIRAANHGARRREAAKQTVIPNACEESTAVIFPLV